MSPLPEFWTEEKDARGRTYYSNHRTRETSWERPVARAPAVPADPPPVYGSNTAAALKSRQLGSCCTPRITFWISCALGWVVWAFAVGAAADNSWLVAVDLAAGDEEVLDSCSSSDSTFCNNYKAFTAMQFVAVVLVSVAMALLMVAPFRPAKAGCGSVHALGLAGGILMAAFSFFQMLAFVLMIVIEKELDNVGDSFNGYDAKLGSTFGVAVVATLLGMFQAGSVLAFVRSSGDGPFFKCFHDCMAMNTDPNAAVRGGYGGGGGTHQQQQQGHQPEAPSMAPLPAPVPVAPVARPASTAPPEPASTSV